MLSRRALALVTWLGGFGLPAAALEPLLARSASIDIDPRPCLVSEKLDGVRALWDGQVLRLRSGRSVAAPAWAAAQAGAGRRAVDREARL